MWKRFFPQSDEESMGPKLLRHEPVPGTIEEQINICLTEEAPENAIGLGIEWTNRADLWPAIMNVLEQNYSHYSRSQLKLFLKHLTFEEAEIPEPEQAPSQNDADLSDTMINELVWRSREDDPDVAVRHVDAGDSTGAADCRHPRLDALLLPRGMWRQHWRLARHRS
jgi:hypothetical protein